MVGSLGTRPECTALWGIAPPNPRVPRAAGALRLAVLFIPTPRNYSCTNSGLLFSMKAFIPIFWSLVEKLE